MSAETVTLLFTDIEGSTRLLHQLGDGYAELLADHRQILRPEAVQDIRRMTLDGLGYLFGGGDEPPQLPPVT